MDVLVYEIEQDFDMNHEKLLLKLSGGVFRVNEKQSCSASLWRSLLLQRHLWVPLERYSVRWILH